jgi:hypothetical protein
MTDRVRNLTGNLCRAKYLLPFFVYLVLSCNPLRHYKDSPQVINWENDIQVFEHLDRSETYPERSVLFTGSSSIRLWENLPEDMAPYPVIRRGYGGAKLSDFAVFAERIIYPHSLSAIVLFIANDIAGNDADKPPKEVLRLFRYVIGSIRKEFPHTPVFWIEVTPTEARWEVWPEIQRANNLIRNYCQRYPDTYFIETGHRFLDEQGMPISELFLPDRLHLNERGYSLWTEIIKSELDRILIR